ncbi:MAG TPA: CDP-alcohol phosphatidyltransferase family protein [Pyrinomonadaceae bacterium]|nr:CDP-alcohol phosphatidyltransferase family protein [Pyrinomonadaceae bacterium]
MQREVYLEATWGREASPPPPNMERQQFAGASKASASFLSPLERRMGRVVVPRIPAWLETHHLTWLTLLWCVLIIAFSYLAVTNIKWLWMVSLMVVCQYVTDHFDGKVGKYRDTGLVKWGFYMDHVLDYAFMCSVLIGYALILPDISRFHMLFLLAVFGGFMVNSFLAFAATAKFNISFLKLGPTEFRIFLVVNNTLLILFGTRQMIKAIPYVASGGLLALCLLVYRTQKKIWKIDMDYKRDAGTQRRPDAATT